MMSLYYSSTSLLDSIWVVLVIIACIGVYRYGAKKKLFYKKFWKMYFVFYVVIDLLYNLIVSPRKNVESLNLGYLIGFLFFIPIYIGLYLYGFKNSNINKKIVG